MVVIKKFCIFFFCFIYLLLDGFVYLVDVIGKDYIVSRGRFRLADGRAEVAGCGS